MVRTTLSPFASFKGSNSPNLSKRESSPMDCVFDKGNMCGWMPDPREGGAQWIVAPKPEGSMATEFDQGVLCLSPYSNAGGSGSFDDEWSDDLMVDESVAQKSSEKDKLNARLWSPKVRQKHTGVAYQCLGFLYRIEQIDARSIEKFQLALLRHSSG
ncbi:hypothetical protein FGIG_03817 [Fasciola gigantica]|uniref:MAM domain-containing protein n=1 Tax=Fasciola gigantica TaxID=46835 RepID=A0A504YB87_FASGI|nr:hypothetical protein FGIG_03817 [Fasciola gigantica]